MSKNEQQAKYQTEVMKDAKQDGCKCPYSEADYRKGDWKHQTGCPAPRYENLPG